MNILKISAIMLAFFTLAIIVEAFLGWGSFVIIELVAWLFATAVTFVILRGWRKNECDTA